MQTLYEQFYQLLELTPMTFFREQLYQINWDVRILGILGQKGVGFYLWEGKAIGANKAYLTLPSAQLAPGRSFGMIFDDGTVTGIPATIIDQPQDDIIYNLQGQKVDESYKGLIIKNGQKVYNY